MPDAAQLLELGNYSGLARAWLEKERDSTPKIHFATGLTGLDDLLEGGFREGSLVVVGAPTGAGKTPMLNTLAVGLARSGERVMLHPLELGRAETMDRIVGSVYGASVRTFRNEMQADIPEYNAMRESALRELGTLPLMVSDPKRGKRATVRACFNSAKKFGASVLVIDHVRELAQWSGKSANGALNADERSMEIGDACAQHGMTCIVAQQLDVRRLRQLRKGERPGIDHFQDTQRLAQIADVALIVHRPYRDNHLLDVVAEVITVKNRYGRIGVSHVEWRGPSMRYVQLDFAHEARLASFCCGLEAIERNRAADKAKRA